MPAVIAYQSLNSNTQKEHGLEASTSQYFLRMAQKKLAPEYDEDSGALRYPVSSDAEPHEAVEGPPNLVSVADAKAMDVSRPTSGRKRKRAEMESDSNYGKALKRTLEMVERKALQIYQQTYRELSLGCDLIAFGELDSTHPDWHRLANAAGQRVGSALSAKACNCFSLHSAKHQGTLSLVGSGEGWCATRCNGVLVVFVHVPNEIAKNQSKMINFYNTIKDDLLNTPDGGVVDLVMGDTNQASSGFSPSAISKGMGASFCDADTNRAFTRPADTWTPDGKVIHRGTNAANNKKFDVAIYNTESVKSISVKYVSQMSFASGNAAAYTDHMGVLAKVQKK